jgi:hypothetical protein
MAAGIDSLREDRDSFRGPDACQCWTPQRPARAGTRARCPLGQPRACVASLNLYLRLPGRSVERSRLTSGQTTHNVDFAPPAAVAKAVHFCSSSASAAALFCSSCHASLRFMHSCASTAAHLCGSCASAAAHLVARMWPEPEQSQTPPPTLIAAPPCTKPTHSASDSSVLGDHPSQHRQCSPLWMLDGCP